MSTCFYSYIVHHNLLNEIVVYFVTVGKCLRGKSYLFGWLAVDGWHKNHSVSYCDILEIDNTGQLQIRATVREYVICS